MYSVNYKYAVQLTLDSNLDLEKRVSCLLKFCNDKYANLRCIIDDIEATGNYGISLTKKVKSLKEYEAKIDEIIDVFAEDGQVFELDIRLFNNEFSARLIIARGQTVDFISNDKSFLDKNILGDYTTVDLTLFNM